jgi:hypothetical protein
MVGTQKVSAAAVYCGLLTGRFAHRQVQINGAFGIKGGNQFRIIGCFQCGNAISDE